MIALRRAQRKHMQHWMQSFISTTTPSAETINDALIDYGFYHTPIQVQRMYAEKVNHGLLGYVGGVIDQPDEYWHDMSTMRWLQLWHEHVAPLARLEQTSWIDNIREHGTLQGKVKNVND